MIRYICPLCSTTLLAEGELLRCAHDGYTNTPVDGIRDFLLPEEESRHTRFIEEYRTIRASEGRGSNDPAHYLALPDVPADDPRRKEWKMRKESAAWLFEQLEQSGPHEGRRVLDAGAGNCWLTRWIAAWGNEAVALDLNIDRYDGLAVGRHYLASLPLTFERVRADFTHLPFPDGTFDVVIFNGAFHYAEERAAVLEEARRVTMQGGSIYIIDSPFYRDRSSGEKMLAERGAEGRAGFLTFDELRELAERVGLGIELHPPYASMLSRLKRKLTERRLGREIATMVRARLKNDER